MAITKTGNFNVTAREVDFVTQFQTQWTALQQILGIMKPIKKAPGTRLISYKTTMADAALQTSPAEGVDITPTAFAVEEVAYGDITIEKYKKATTIEAIAKYGSEIAIQKTDAQFRTELQSKVMNEFYKFLKTGTLKGTQKTWQRALAIAKGAVLDKFAGMHKTVTEVVGFANIMDLYDNLGDKEITVQSQFGLQYIKDYLGYGTLFLLPESIIPSKTVIALPVENIDLYYIDPADSAFASGDLNYVVEGETNLIGFHTQGNYSNATSECYALMGMTLWAEYLDGIAIVTVGSSNTTPTVAGA